MAESKQDYHSDIVERAHEVEDLQNEYQGNYRAYLKDFRFPEEFIDNAREAIDINTKDRDPRDVMIVHQPMANPLRPHRLVALAGLAHMFPDRRIISYGNDGHPGNKHMKLNSAARQSIALGDFRPYTSRISGFVGRIDPKRVVNVGDSLGSELAMVTSSSIKAEDNQVVAIEPVRVKPRSLWGLGKAFKSTEKHFRKYLDENQQDVYTNAFEKQGGGNVGYPLGLLRLSNLAVASGLTKNKFGEETAIALNSGSRVRVVRGGSSELADNDGMQIINQQLKEGLVSDGSYADSVLVGDTHAFTNNLFKLNTVIAQSIKDLDSN